LLISVLEINV